MQDRELVAAIVASDPDGLAEAYDRYAAPLYTYCRFMLPAPHPPDGAADAVADTFIIATVKLSGLRDPDQLAPWLNAVARNECLRQIGAAEGTSGGGRLAAEGAASPPAGLRERVLKECADSTPAGRAHRMSMTHRAGSFGRKGFPKPVIPPGPRWWHEVRRHPRAAVGVAAAAATIVLAGSVALAIPGGSHRSQASTIALGGDGFATSRQSSSAASGRRSTPGRKPGAATRPSAPATGRPNADPGGSPAMSRSPASARSSPGTGSSASPSPSPSPSPTPGTLGAAPTKLALTAAKGKAGSGTFLLTAVGGPVNFVITSSNAKVTASPSSGSLDSAGSWVTVTVTVRSLVAVNARLTVNPGQLIITVAFSIKA